MMAIFLTLTLLLLIPVLVVFPIACVAFYCADAEIRAEWHPAWEASAPSAMPGLDGADALVSKGARR